jgi:hypothetical protein
LIAASTWLVTSWPCWSFVTEVLTLTMSL